MFLFFLWGAILLMVSQSQSCWAGRSVSQQVCKQSRDNVIIIFLDSNVSSSRPTFSQLWCFKMRRWTFLNYIKFANLMIARLLNCERAGWVIITHDGNASLNSYIIDSGNCTGKIGKKSRRAFDFQIGLWGRFFTCSV